mmetsp:Transcript_36018/g.64725  ORF Transcript_36018/g.64725 Transcript_36018/m.64725 type:complete len:244 (+) Transcript_36018:74-805(+)
MLRMCALTAYLAVARGAFRCSTYTGRSCDDCEGDNMYCSASQDLCRCKWGSCAYKDTCTTEEHCVRSTHGTCRMLACKTSRGWTDCVDGLCVCQHDACNRQGWCTKACEYRIQATVEDDGGTCNILPCDASRHAICEGPGTDDYWGPHGFRCVCPEGTCAANGACFPAGWSPEAEYFNSSAVKATGRSHPANGRHALWLAMPSADDPVVLVTASLFAGLVGVGLAMRRCMQRHRINAPEMMLG